MTNQQMVKELSDIEAMASALLSHSSRLRIAIEKTLVRKPKKSGLTPEMKARLIASLHKRWTKKKIDK